jgi:hypothetical protein
VQKLMRRFRLSKRLSRGPRRGQRELVEAIRGQTGRKFLGKNELASSISSQQRLGASGTAFQSRISPSSISVTNSYSIRVHV